MTTSDFQQAEQAARTRALMMAIMAVILLGLAILGFEDEASTMRPWLRHGAWALLILLWLAVLATGGWLRLSRDARRVMNDEVALANRSRGLEAGFWAAMTAGLAIYFASFAWDLSLREGLRLVTELGIAAALLRYAWLELR